MSEYEAGTCNINQLESKKRLVTGFAGFLNAMILVVVLLFFPSLKVLFLPIFLLCFTGFLGYFQYRASFCAGLALKGRLHVGESEEEVKDEEKVSRDRRKAAKIILKSLIPALILTAVLVLIGLNGASPV